MRRPETWRTKQHSYGYHSGHQNSNPNRAPNPRQHNRGSYYENYQSNDRSRRNTDQPWLHFGHPLARVSSNHNFDNPFNRPESNYQFLHSRENRHHNHNRSGGIRSRSDDRKPRDNRNFNTYSHLTTHKYQPANKFIFTDPAENQKNRDINSHIKAFGSERGGLRRRRRGQFQN